MAKLCTNCGKALPEDEVRFCSNCGAAVLPDSSNTQPPKSSGSRSGGSRPGLREQIAQQPFPRPARSSIREEPPGWLSGLDREAPDSSVRTGASANMVEGATQSGQGKQRQPSLREAGAESEIDELPTLPFIANVPQTPQSRERVQPQFPAGEEIEMLDTRPVSAQEHTVATSNVPSPISASPSRPPRQPAQDRPRGPQGMARTPTSGKARRRQGGRLMAVLIACCLLLLGGIAAWTILLQPFSVPAVTQPRQNFNDSALGVSLLYPAGWKSSVDQHTLTARFSDSSDTAQVIIAMTDAVNKEPAQYFKQQAAQLGMTAVKTGAPVAFAGSSWQQLQGDVLQKGASYTETMLGTIHGNHLFTLVQAAPQKVYQDEERVVFAPMRSSFSFLS